MTINPNSCTNSMYIYIFFTYSPLSTSENSAFDGELSWQPEGSGTRQPIGTTPGPDTGHL